MQQYRSSLIVGSTFGLVLLGSRVWAQDTMETSSTAEGQVVPYTGPLQRSRSPTYYPLRASTPVRAGPSITAPVVSIIAGQGQALRALGMAIDPDTASYQSISGDAALAQRWIKVAIGRTETGFVSLADLLTPNQLSGQKESNRKIALFASEIDAAKRASGGTVPSGIYAHGSSCEADGLSGSAFANFLSSKFLLWQEGLKLHFVQVVNPTEPLLYEQQADGHPVELRGYGYVMLQTFRSSKDAVLMGYKDKVLWISPNGSQFDNYQFCGPEAYEPVSATLKSYANQRPPENRR